ncbi:unnamed protein product [Arctogadus glacialis]
MIQRCTNQIKAPEFTGSLEEMVYRRHDASLHLRGPVSPPRTLQSCISTASSHHLLQNAAELLTTNSYVPQSH